MNSTEFKNQKSHSLLLLILLTATILTVGLIPIFFNWTHLGFFDFTSQQIPFIIETKRMLASGTPWWSWNTFIGDNFIAGYSFYTLTSPFVWITVLFPYKWIYSGLLINLYLKTILTSAFSFLYFRRMGFDNNLSIIGGLLYAFSSFYIVNLYYFHFAEPILLFPLLLIAIENILQERRFSNIFLSFITFLIVFINYYFALPSLILGSLYFLFRSVGARKITLGIYGRFILSVLLGILMASIILFPVVSSLIGTPRALPGRAIDTITDDSEQGFILKLISKYLPRILAFFIPTIFEAEPQDSLVTGVRWISLQPFVTIFGVLPFIIYAIKRRDWLTWMVFLLFIIFLTPLNGIFYLFTSVSYGRWLYGLIILLILATLHVIKDNMRIPPKTLRLYFFLCLFLITAAIVFAYYISSNTKIPFFIDNDRWWQLGAILLNFGCLIVWVYKRNDSKLLLCMIGICSTFNLWAFTSCMTEKTDTHKSPVSLINNAMRNESSTIGEVSMEYRTDYVTGYKNIAMLENMPGIYSFHSVFNKNLIPFRSVIDEDPSEPSFNINKGSRESVAALLSVKKVIIEPDISPNIKSFSRGLTSSTRRDDELEEFEFRYYIPMGFSYNSYIPLKELEAIAIFSDSIDIPSIMLANLVIEEKDEAALSSYLTQGKAVPVNNLDSLARERRQFTAQNFRGNSEGFNCTTDFINPQVLFFSVPADKGFRAYIDNINTPIYNVNLGMSAIIVPAGKHAVTFKYHPPGLKAGFITSCVSFLVFLCWLLISLKNKT